MSGKNCTSGHIYNCFDVTVAPVLPCNHCPRELHNKCLLYKVWATTCVIYPTGLFEPQSEQSQLVSNWELMAANSLIQRGDRREKETTMLAPEKVSVAATASECGKVLLSAGLGESLIYQLALLVLALSFSWSDWLKLIIHPSIQ